jgi:hypothetical protein
MRSINMPQEEAAAEAKLETKKTTLWKYKLLQK